MPQSLAASVSERLSETIGRPYRLSAQVCRCSLQPVICLSTAGSCWICLAQIEDEQSVRVVRRGRESSVCKDPYHFYHFWPFELEPWRWRDSLLRVVAVARRREEDGAHRQSSR